MNMSRGVVCISVGLRKLTRDYPLFIIKQINLSNKGLNPNESETQPTIFS